MSISLDPGSLMFPSSPDPQPPTPRTHPNERILELDTPLSYGMADVKQDSASLNSVSFLWDPTRLTANCPNKMPKDVWLDVVPQGHWRVYQGALHLHRVHA
jgi:hypothetical protein